MKRFFIYLVAMLCAIQSSAQIEIKVEQENIISTNNGYWEGWGTSLCWWANRIGYNKELTKRSANLFFSNRGLGLNIMRYNIGGGDNPSHNHITRTDSDVPGWLYYDAKTESYHYDHNADFRQLNVLKAAAKAAGRDAYIEAFLNSPPYFMTVSGCSSGNFKAGENNIRDDAYNDVANYVAYVTNHLCRELGLKVRSVSPMNEPNTNYWGAFSSKQEGCHIDEGEMQSKLITLTAASLAEYGLEDVIVVASDETNPALQQSAMEKMSNEATAVIGRINSHTYGTNGIKELGEYATNSGKNIWMSEVDGNGTAGTKAGEMAAGLWLSNKIISDIQALRPSAWVLWQVIDTHISKDGYMGRRDGGALKTEGGYWGTAYANHDTGDIILTQKYFSFGQFTRYIRPGATLINCFPQSANCKALAAVEYTNKNRDNIKSITIVCTNTLDSEEKTEIDISSLSERRLKVDIIRTSGSMVSGEHWESVVKGDRCYGGRYTTLLAPNSVTTFIFRL